MKPIPHVVRVVPTKSRTEMVEITAVVSEAIGAMHLVDGILTVLVPHTTAGITINENVDPNVQHDLLKKLAEMIPHRERFYKHIEGNSDSHVKSMWTGNSVHVIVEGGKLLLGQWQGIYFCEFDGPRERQVWIKAVGFQTA